jgi:hypothetical protein
MDSGEMSEWRQRIALAAGRPLQDETELRRSSSKLGKKGCGKLNADDTYLRSLQSLPENAVSKLSPARTSDKQTCPN